MSTHFSQIQQFGGVVSSFLLNNATLDKCRSRNKFWCFKAVTRYCFIYHNIRYLWYFFPNSPNSSNLKRGSTHDLWNLLKDSSAVLRKIRTNIVSMNKHYLFHPLLFPFSFQAMPWYKLRFCGLEFWSLENINCSNNHNILCVSVIYELPRILEPFCAKYEFAGEIPF